MRYIVIPVLAIVILLCILLSGCTGSSGTETPATTVPATTPAVRPVVVTTLTTTITTIKTIEPVRTLPPERQVTVVLTKDRPTSEIHLLYQGGPGDILVTGIIMRVYSADGHYEQYIMSNGKKPIPGDEIVAPGTRNPDRCEVFVISSGTRFKVMDENAVGGMYY
jgi:hypothetical protein